MSHGLTRERVTPAHGPRRRAEVITLLHQPADIPTQAAAPQATCRAVEAAEATSAAVAGAGAATLVAVVERRQAEAEAITSFI